MLVRGVVHHQINQNTNAALLCAMGKLDEIAEGAVARIDIVIVGDVIAVVAAWRSLERHQPNRGHPKSMQIIQAPHKSLEIANAVAVGIHVCADGKAVDYCVFIPEIVNHPCMELSLVNRSKSRISPDFSEL